MKRRNEMNTRDHNADKASNRNTPTKSKEPKIKHLLPPYGKVKIIVQPNLKGAFEEQIIEKINPTKGLLLSAKVIRRTGKSQIFIDKSETKELHIEEAKGNTTLEATSPQA